MLLTRRLIVSATRAGKQNTANAHCSGDQTDRNLNPQKVRAKQQGSQFGCIVHRAGEADRHGRKDVYPILSA